MTTVRFQAASTIVHATFTVTFTQVASIRDSRLCFLFFRRENESTLLTIYHYKVNF